MRNRETVSCHLAPDDPTAHRPAQTGRVVHWQQPLTQGLVLATTFARLSPVVPLVVAAGIIGLALFIAGRGGRRK